MENDKTIGIVKLIASFFNGGIGITKATESNVIKDDKSNIIKEKNDLSIPKSSDEILEIDNERDNYMNSENTYDINDTSETSETYIVNDYVENNIKDEEVDNSDISMHGYNICIRLNDENKRRNRLKTSQINLLKKFPKLYELPSETLMQNILDGVFTEGFQKQMYIRNLTFTHKNGYDIKVLGIRPERTPGDFLEDYLPNNVSLLFKGHIAGKEFRVDSVYEVMDTEQLDFEVDVNATPYRTPDKIRMNFLYDILANAGSLTQYTEEKLEEWNQYLDWKKELANRQIYGCKFFKIGFDENKMRLNFWLVFENQDIFKAFKKYLSRDIQVFDNSYSKDPWHFDFAGDMNNTRQRFRSIELGRYRGIVSEYYLKNNRNKIIDSDSTENHFFDDDISINDDEENENDVSIENIYNAYSNPYIVQVAYELNHKDMDEIKQLNLNDEEAIQYIYNNILGNYYKDGFLALSAIGDFVLIKRFQIAIEQLKKDESYSPNLAMWLFNVKRARIPEEIDIKIDKWLNPRIENNENQKEAVRKMISAPDLCLIQGPPGTGKTTVIAEAIYQFVRRGDRVLVASQSNDAVDNALERLVESPDIRAIRLGQKGKRKRRVDDKITNKFGEDEALKYYYNALSNQLSKTWIDLWDSMESDGIQYDIDIRDASLFQQDLASLNQELTVVNKKYIESKEYLDSLNKQLEIINGDSIKLEADKKQYRLAVECFNGENDLQFYLSEDLIRIFEKELNNLIERTIKTGIILVEERLNVDEMGLYKVQNDVYLISKRLKTLKGLYKKIQNSKGDDRRHDSDILILNSQLAEINENLLICIKNEDEEGKRDCINKISSIQLQIDKLQHSSSVVSISETEKIILHKNIIEGINNDDPEKWSNTFAEIIKQWDQSIDLSLNKIKNIINSRKSIDTTDIFNHQKATESKIVEIKEKINEIKSQQLSKSQTLLKLREKYGINTTNAEEIISYIKQLKESNLNKLNEHRSLRDDWEKTLREFKLRLEDKDSFKYDQEYYQQIYVNACNVVGISCTDNMKNLSDNGYNDFDVVIIDEVSKATPPELLIPLMKARKAVLVGDHRQLPPMFKEHEGSYKELVESQDDTPEEIKELLTKENFKKFENMVTSSLFKDYFEQASETIKHSLLVQYRMHSDIMEIINRFYEQRLSCGNSEEVERLEKNHDLTIKGVDGSTFIKPENHAYWVDSSALPSGRPIYEVRPNYSTSNYNVLEKYIIIELLKKIAHSYKEKGYSKENKKTVGVISFYQMQVNEIREIFREAKNYFDFSSIDVDINTVDRFQGKEKNIIITSLVRNNRKGHASKHVVAFERINVAFSRAQELLIIVGAKHMYENQSVKLPNMDMPGFKTAPVYKNIMEGLNRKGCFKTCNKIITPEIEEKIVDEYKEMGGK
ncbi:DEAD/DEAH box helicase [Veillonella atypica]|jgi:possible helicase|uniref:DEAD/DEAH box helicase n=1 Tax=Veillonella atypica TaxID=39777 RepID=UPI00290BB784|nr:AAA domain-containing protein [Veillonella atypica]MDU4149537.1 AAA domain-containing protein [Veillonella sp.]